MKLLQAKHVLHHSLKMSVLLKITCLMVLSESLTAAVITTEYWVRPDTVLECPQDIQYHQCFTITDLVLYSFNSSLNQGRNITIRFLPGVHTTRVGGRILIENRNTSTQVIATINGDQRDGLEAVVHCSLQDRKIIFVFQQLHQLKITSVKIINCGNKTKVNLNSNGHSQLPFNMISYTYNKVASLAIINAEPRQNSVSMDHVIVHNSSGFGVLVIQYCSQTHGSVFMPSLLNMYIINCIIQYSNSYQHGEGGNVVVIAKSELYIYMYNSTISYGKQGTKQTVHNTFLENGGLNIYPEDGLSYSEFKICRK